MYLFGALYDDGKVKFTPQNHMKVLNAVFGQKCRLKFLFLTIGEPLRNQVQTMNWHQLMGDF